MSELNSETVTRLVLVWQCIHAIVMHYNGWYDVVFVYRISEILSLNSGKQIMQWLVWTSFLSRDEGHIVNKLLCLICYLLEIKIYYYTCDVCYNVFDCFVRDVCIPLWLWWLWPKRGRGVGWGCFYFTSFSRHAYLASTSFRFVLQVFYLLVTKVTIRYFLNRGNLVLV